MTLPLRRGGRLPLGLPLPLGRPLPLLTFGFLESSERKGCGWVRVRVSGVGCRVSGVGCRVSGVVHRVKGCVVQA